MNIYEAITTYAKRDYTNFDMSNQWIGSIPDFGSLNCIYGKTVIASDTWKTQHSILCKLPPLTAPAFTRIKGIVNTFYTSYASVWKHWNSFISNKPSDQYVSRNLVSAFNGKYVEPCVNAQWIWFICKIAYMYFDIISVDVATNSLSFTVFLDQTTTHPVQSFATWTTENGFRKANYIPVSSGVTDYRMFFNIPVSSNVSNLTSLTEYCHRLGFANFESYFYYCCQKVVQNLQNHGIPCYEIAKNTDPSSYSDILINLLPFMCESSIWHNFYRDVQNQSPEPCYEDVNGSIYPFFNIANAYETLHKVPYGWKIRMLDTPVNFSNDYDSFCTIDSAAKCFSLLTGFLAEGLRPDSIGSSADNVFIHLNYYNGLLALKYRNFEKDYFTSASNDPLLGGLSIATPNTIDALRTASKLEEFLERSTSARDFYNFMKYTFDTNPESTRYSKPLLLGTQVVPIQIGEQLQTSQTTQGENGSPLGERAGIAEGFGSQGTADHYFNEHGWICSYLSFVIDSQYMQGIDISDYFHHNQLDYPFPDFANLGAEPIMKSEIYFSQRYDFQVDQRSVEAINGNDATISQDVVSRPLPNFDQYRNFGSSEIQLSGSDIVVDDHSLQEETSNVLSKRVFGYTPRYTRWKFCRDVVSGEMLSSLEFWHTFRHFHSEPKIGSSFVSYRDAGWLSDLNRIFAVENDNADKYYLFIQNHCSVRRCLPLVPNTQLN